MHSLSELERPSILSYLSDPDLPPALIESFFHAAIDYADAMPWTRLSQEAHFPILLSFQGSADPPRGPERRLAMILGGEGSGGDAVGLVLVEDLPSDGADAAPAHPALSVIYAGYPELGLGPLVWRGRPLPRSRAGLIPWPSVHDSDDRVRAPRRAELIMMVGGLLSVLHFVRGYPAAVLDDDAAHPHACQLLCELRGEGLMSRLHVGACTYPLPA